MALFLLAMVTFERLLSVYTSVWLAYWSENHYDLPQGDYLAIYAGDRHRTGGCVVGEDVHVGARELGSCKQAPPGALPSDSVHAASFFDVTPLGRVIQRFTKDTAVMDNTLGNSVASFTSFGLLLLGTLAVMAWVMPALMPAWCPSALSTFTSSTSSGPGTGRRSASTASADRLCTRILARPSRVSPRFARLATRGGSSTRTRRGISINQRADYTQKCGCDRWLPVRLETIGNSITFVVAVLGVWQRGSTYAALVGLTLSYAIDMTGLLSWLIRVISVVESTMVSVERISEFTELETEESTGAIVKGGPKKPPSG